MAARRERVTVTIERCNQLRSVDTSIFSNSKSDPYVRCLIQDRPYYNFTTDVCKRTLDPVFEFTQSLEVQPGDNLEFVVFHQGAQGDEDDKREFLGRTVVPYAGYSRGFDDTLFLEDIGEKWKGKSSISVQIRVTPLPHHVDPEATRVFIRLVRGLQMRGSRKSYAIAQVVGEKSTVSTKVATGDTPVWDEEDEIAGFKEGDDLKISVYEFVDRPMTEHPLLGEAILCNEDFHPDGMEGDIQLGGPKSLCKGSSLEIAIDVVIPVKPKVVQIDPGAHVLPGEHWPVPFALRSLESGRVHQLAAYTCVGRSRKKLDPSRDLVIDSPASVDVSRFHAFIKVWQVPDSDQWKVRVYPAPDAVTGGSGAGLGPGGGHDGGGTSVHDVSVSREMQERLEDGTISRGDWFKGHRVDEEIGTGIDTGTIVRFGLNEFWVLERNTLFQRSQLAATSMKKTRTLNLEDPAEVRHLVVPNIAALHALQGCNTWFDFITVVLEWLGEPDEPPCVEHIEIQDELRQPIARHVTSTLEEQEEYDLKRILQDVQIGHTVRIKLCSDPMLLGPVLNFLEDKKKQQDKILQRRDKIPD